MNVKIMGADQSVTNRNGDNYEEQLQASTARSRLYKLSFSPLSGMAADLYAWIFDDDGTNDYATRSGPVAVRLLPAGVADTWDFNSDGSLFQRGILVVLAQSAPADATETPDDVTLGGANKVIIKADVRIG